MQKETSVYAETQVSSAATVHVILLLYAHVYVCVSACSCMYIYVCWSTRMGATEVNIRRFIVVCFIWGIVFQGTQS